MTEFEETLCNILAIPISHYVDGEENQQEHAKHFVDTYGDILLSDVRKQIASEIDIYSLQDKFANSSHGNVPTDLYNYWEKLDEVFLKGIEETLKAMEEKGL